MKIYFYQRLKALSLPWRLALIFSLLHFWIILALVLLSMDSTRFFSILDDFVSYVDFPLVIVSDYLGVVVDLIPEMDWGDRITILVYYFMIGGSLFYFCGSSQESVH